MSKNTAPKRNTAKRPMPSQECTPENVGLQSAGVAILRGRLTWGSDDRREIRLQLVRAEQELLRLLSIARRYEGAAVREGDFAQAERIRYGIMDAQARAWPDGRIPERRHRVQRREGSQSKSRRRPSRNSKGRRPSRKAA